MGKIKKIIENELVGGTQNIDIYPVTSTKAVYNEDNQCLDDIIIKKDNELNNLKIAIIASTKLSIIKNENKSYTYIVPESVLALFDICGGYRFIGFQTYQLATNQVFVLSGSPTEQTPVDVATKGTGQIIYFFAKVYSALSEADIVVAFNWGGNIQSAFNCLLPKNNESGALQLTNYINIIDKTESAIKCRLDGSVLLLNMASGMYAGITGIYDFSTMPHAPIILTKQLGEFDPYNFDSDYISTLYLYQLASWNTKNTSDTPYTIACYPIADDNLGVTLYGNEGFKINDNYNLSPGIGADVNGIRSLCFTEILKLDLVVKGDKQSIKELWLDTINKDEIIFGAWTNPENSADKGVYRQVAKATLLASDNNFNILDYKIEPLNDTGLEGYMQTNRAFFNHFYNNSNVNDWSSDGTGEDLFCKFNISKLRVDSSKATEDLIYIYPEDYVGQNPLSNWDSFKALGSKNKDTTILMLGDSISTNGNYTSSLQEAPYLPPRIDENYIGKHIYDLIKWQGQSYRRGDAMKDELSSDSMFGEVADTKTTKYYDAAWDWQRSNLESNYYRLWTRVLEGTNCSVSFTIPAGHPVVSFIYRTDYLCATNTKVIIGQGDAKCRIIDESGELIEANGYNFSMKEEDVLITVPGATDKLRKSQGQKTLRFNVDASDIDLVVTLENQGSGRLNYWGVVMSKTQKILNFVNVARGGHGIKMLEAFESWDIDNFKPDLIIYQCMIINEGAVSIAPQADNTPEQFSERFLEHINHLKSKSWNPDVLPHIQYIGRQAGIVNEETGEYQNSGENANGYYQDVYQYVGALADKLKSNQIICVNNFGNFDRIATEKSELSGTKNKWVSAIQGSGHTGTTFTSDSVHFNNYGAKLAYLLLKKYLVY